MNIVKYEAFLKSIELNSVTKAAKEMGYTQPGVTHMLNSLEEEIGFPLLKRSKDSVIPTDNGRAFIPLFQEIITTQNAIEETVDLINGVLSGTIRIAAFNTMLISHVPDIVSSFTNEYPQIEIHIEEMAYTEIISALSKGTIDIAFMNDDIPAGFDFIPLADDSICIILPESHPLAEKEKLSLSDLDGIELIGAISGWDDNYNILQKIQPFTPKITHRVASDTVAMYMVQKKLGAYIISSHLKSFIPEGVVFREFEESPERRLGMCLRDRRLASPAVRTFLQMAQDI